MRQRYVLQFQKAREIIKAGGIGTVYKVHLTWNRNSPRSRRARTTDRPENRRLEGVPRQARRRQPFDEYHFTQLGAGSGTSAAAS